jgi:transposase
MLLVGYFEDIDSQHGIVWRCSDSLSLTSFLSCQPHEATAEHSSLTWITSRLPLEIDREVLAFVLPLPHEQGLLKGTTLEANAAMTSIVRKDRGDDWETHRKNFAAAEEIEISWRADAARFDQQRAKTRKKKCSHDDWPSPSDPDGRITKLPAGSTDLADKTENAVDLDTGAITAAEIDHADQADSATREDTRGIFGT